MSAGGWTLLALVGGLGAVVRHAAAARSGGILAVNLAGAFALGFLAASAAGPDTMRIVAIGFLGAMTTFSTWMLQCDDHLAGGRRVAAGALLLGALVAGAAAFAAGRGLA